MENQLASARQKPLSLVDMSTAFVLLGLGISLAILVFLLELIYKRISDHYFNTNLVNKIIIKATPKPPGDKKARVIPKSAGKQGNAMPSKTLVETETGNINVDIKKGPANAITKIPTPPSKTKQGNAVLTKTSADDKKGTDIKQGLAIPAGNQRKVTPNWDEIKEI